MAYNFIPKSVKEIESKPQLGANKDQIVALFGYLTDRYKTIKEPLAIDPTKSSSVKVTRALTGTVNLSTLKRDLGLTLTLAFGNGSRGGQGAANKGTLFERMLLADIDKWVAGETITDRANKRFVDEFVKEYRLDSAKSIKTRSEGELNQRRPLVFSGRNIYVGGNNFNIGKTITDITVEADGAPIYLSLKYGNKVTFFNAGVAKYLSQQEIASGTVQNSGGQAILDLFGIDNARFCSVFNSYGSGDESASVKGSENTFNKLDRTRLQDLIKSGIGYGYHLVHKTGSAIHHFPISAADLNRYSTPQSCIVHYGGIGSADQAKRVDMVVKTLMFTLQFNIRSKTGGVYPTHFMADYTINH